MHRVLVAFVAVSGLAQAGEEPFFPLSKGYRWEYRGSPGRTGMEITEVSGERFAVELTLQGRPFSKLYYRLAKDGLYLEKQAEYTGKGDSLVEFKEPILILPLPAQPGRKWTGKYTIGGHEMEYRCEILAEEAVVTPAGTFRALPVVRKSSADARSYSKEWYAPGIGLVRRLDVFEDGGTRHEMSTDLLKHSAPEKETLGTKIADRVNSKMRDKMRAGEVRTQKDIDAILDRLIAEALKELKLKEIPKEEKDSFEKRLRAHRAVWITVLLLPDNE